MRPVVDIGAPVWAATAPTEPVRDHLRADLETDVVVVGAGFTGLATALSLAERGVACVVVEAHEPGAGASGRNAGWWLPGWPVMRPQQIMARLGDRAGGWLCDMVAAGARRVAELARTGDVCCNRNAGGGLLLARRTGTLDRLERDTRFWENRGLRIELLDQDKVRARVCSRVFIGGAHFLDAGTVNPLAFVRLLAGACEDAGARIFVRTPIVMLANAGDCWQLRTPQATITARRVLLATNAFPALHPRLKTIGYRVRIAMIASAPMAAGARAYIPGGLPFVDLDSKGLLAVNFDRDGRLVNSVLPTAARCATPARLARPYWRLFRRCFPQAPEQTQWQFAWYGTEAFVPGMMPRLCRPAPGLYALQGYSGAGIAQAVGCGPYLAALLAGDDPGLLPQALAGARAMPLAHPVSLLLNRVLLPAARLLAYR